MAEFNLIDEPWIPCIDLNDQQIEYGIRDTLLKAHELREICDDSPLVTVAIHRLLLAILYRAHSGPKDFEMWKNMYKEQKFNENRIGDYLDQHKNRFYLMSNDYPFYQMAHLETNKEVSVIRLASECSSGNNATLFDHSYDEEDINWTPTQTAKYLIACQSFALGFGKSGSAKNDKDEKLPYFSDAIALRGMNVWLQGSRLFDTLLINLVPHEDNSLPPWELGDPHMYRNRRDAHGIVDRFTWQSRLIRLRGNGNAFSKMYFMQGRSADKSVGDPMKVYRISKEEGISALSLSSDKAVWRDAHSILTVPPPTSRERRPECFNTLARARRAKLIPADERFIAHVVGIASAPKRAGKFLLWRHERLPLASKILDNNTFIERLGDLLKYSEQKAQEQHSRMWKIARFYIVPSSGEPSEKQEEDIGALVKKLDPRPAYWARLEKHFFDLLQNLPNDWDTEADDWKPDDQQHATRTWRKAVLNEARRALEESVRALGTTARAISAIARVGTDFSEKDLKPQPQHSQPKEKKSKPGKKGGKNK